jgi:hypothetical protein
MKLIKSKIALRYNQPFHGSSNYRRKENEQIYYRNPSITLPPHTEHVLSCVKYGIRLYLLGIKLYYPLERFNIKHKMQISFGRTNEKEQQTSK